MGQWATPPRPVSQVCHTTALVYFTAWVAQRTMALDVALNPCTKVHVKS